MESSSSPGSSSSSRPKSANPRRRGKTAVEPNYPEQGLPEQENIFEVEPEEDFPLQGQPEVRRRSAESGARPLSADTVPTCESLRTYECMQKASALRVLAKTLDRQRDVAATSVDLAELASLRKTTPQPRKLKPLGRESSGPF